MKTLKPNTNTLTLAPWQKLDVITKQCSRHFLHDPRQSYIVLFIAREIGDLTPIQLSEILGIHPKSINQIVLAISQETMQDYSFGTNVGKCIADVRVLIGGHKIARYKEVLRAALKHPNVWCYKQ